jgi:hypothetical protein
MTPGKPKIKAPGQKMAPALAIRTNVLPDFSDIMTPGSISGHPGKALYCKFR